MSCETPVLLSFLQLTYSQEICQHSGENRQTFWSVFHAYWDWESLNLQAVREKFRFQAGSCHPAGGCWDKSAFIGDLFIKTIVPEYNSSG